jgi:nicotinamidase-related amidase
MKNIIILSIIVLTLFSANHVYSQKTDSTALIIIDIQDFYFPGGSLPLFEPEKAAAKAAIVLDYFRKNKALVVHVRHESKSGSSIYKLVAPLPGEKVIPKNEVNAFLKTDLENYLRENKISKLVLCGMQTHMCLEAATRAAHDLGFDCTVIDDACATRDLKYGEILIKAKDVHCSTLATLKSYAKIMTIAEFTGK